MEMEFKDPARKRRLFLVMIGAVLAAAAGLGAFTLASKGSAPAVVPTKSILVAARDIPARTTVSADDVTTRNVPIDEALSQSYALPTDVVGRVTSIPIYTDQQVTPNLFATSSADTDFSILGTDEQVTTDSPVWRAVAINIPPERAVGGDVKAGNHVDIIVSVDFELFTLNSSGEYVKTDTANAQGFEPGKSTKLTFQDLEVLKATPDDDMYVFKVTLIQAEEIAHVIQLAPDAFTLVLRPDEDTRPVDESQYGTTTDRLIMYYMFPAPVLVDPTQLLGPSPYPVAVGTPIPGSGNQSSSPAPNASAAPDSSSAPTESQAPAESPAASPVASATP